MKAMKLVALSLIALALSVPGMASAFDYGTHKVVYHVNYDDERRYMAATGNIQNHINAVGAENMEIKVVMHGDGLGLLQRAKDNEDLRARIDNLKMQNVEFMVCANTLAGRNIDLHNDLYDASEDDVIPSGVAHISYLQHKGFTYSKP
ncbi:MULTISPECIES: DsrE family protein [unclassified Thioalkalivibrio]|uniref:DsrE family protein n=1 Tax=unclassified Thioalkalivibrio TaxID=2621013 RepID=UPI0003A7E1EF|nr:MULTISPECIES: DsrE family protein [unclassified Thioalkalivibrio]